MKNLLLMEDESIIALEYKSIPERNGYHVTRIVNNGRGAIDVDLESKPDFILMDINIKGKMNGIEAAKEIYDKQIRSTIIFIKAYDVAAYVFPEFKYHILNKPISRNTPLNLLNNYLCLL